MGDTILWKYCAWLALFSSPAIPLAYAWRRIRADRSSLKVVSLIPLVTATVSLCWFDAAVTNFRFLGPLYGELHYAITGGNLLAALLCALFCLLTGFRRGARAARLVTCIACLLLAAEWTFLGIANR